MFPGIHLQSISQEFNPRHNFEYMNTSPRGQLARWSAKLYDPAARISRKALCFAFVIESFIAYMTETARQGDHNSSFRVSPHNHCLPTR